VPHVSAARVCGLSSLFACAAGVHSDSPFAALLDYRSRLKYFSCQCPPTTSPRPAFAVSLRVQRGPSIRNTPTPVPQLRSDGTRVSIADPSREPRAAGAGRGRAVPVVAGAAAAWRRRRERASAESPRFMVDPQLVAADAEENLRGWVKTRGSLVPGEEVVFWWTGDIYGLVEDEQNRHLFAFEGYNIGRMMPVSGGWRLLTREVGIYRDPVTREILKETSAWSNPYSGAENELVHIWNDPVNQQFLVHRSPDGTPRRGGVPTTISGDDLYWHAEISLCYPSPLPASQFPASARTDMYHSLEMFQFFCKTEDLQDETPSADCQISWVRVGQWLPWMEMGDRPGRMVYHCRGKKLTNGYADLSPSVRDFVETHHAEYAHAPNNYSSPNETSWTYFKKLLEAKGTPRADGTIAIAEDAPLSSGAIEEQLGGVNGRGKVDDDVRFTAAELANFNGEDVDKPIYLSLGGHVFDVTSAKRHYRRGETYNCLTGRDATCAFISGDLSEEGLARGTPSAGDPLTAKQNDDLEHWIGFFSENYPQVGRLVAE
jgi:predicted heme/steroid binding protein